jgi:hypothetical protein
LRRGTQRGAFAAVAGLLLLVVGVVVLATTGGGESRGTMELTVTTIALEGNRLTADVSVANDDATRHEIEVWLTLGVFGSGDAWSRRVAELDTQALAVKSGETRVLSWEADLAVPEGWYEVTAWTRLDGASERVLTSTGPDSVRVEESAPISRIAPADGAARIDTVGLAIEGGDFIRIDGPVDIARPADTDEPFEIKVDILEDVPDQPWWALPAAASTLLDTETTGIDDRATASLDQLVPLPPGDYRVRVELWYDEALLDQVLLGPVATVDEPDPTIMRSGLPVGPVAIVSATADADWADDGDHVVEVEVQNLSDEPVEVLMWWLLAAPGDPAPWEMCDARSFEIGRRLDSFERRTVRLAMDGNPPEGRGFEFSAWVHVVSDDGSSVHSDGVRLTQLIDAPAGSRQGA